MKFTCPSAAAAAAETGDGVISLCIRCRQPCHSSGAASRSVKSDKRRLPAGEPTHASRERERESAADRRLERGMLARSLARDMWN